MIDTLPETVATDPPEHSSSAAGSSAAAPIATTPITAAARAATPPARPARSRAVLEQLAGIYPRLFGAAFEPLKRGIFQDLLAAHPELFEREALKAALAFHTRSTRYLSSVAAGHKRLDLQGQPVEDMAPEHVHHALIEVFRRRQGRSAEDLRAKLCQRLVDAFEASKLSREAYCELVRSRDAATNAVLDEALAEAAARAARDEALLRAFEASASDEGAFAAMYGMDPRVAGRSLQRARTRRGAAA